MSFLVTLIILMSKPISATSIFRSSPCCRHQHSEPYQSTISSLPVSLRWTVYVGLKSPKGWLKNAKWPFSVKKCTLLEDSLLQSFLYEYCQRRSCKAFRPIYPFRAQMVRVGRPLLRENLTETNLTASKTPISNLYSLACASSVTPSEKVQLTRIGSLLPAFNEPMINSVRCPWATMAQKRSVENLNNNLR